MMRLYRLLLRLYPASFRAEYGAEMSAIFARRLRDVRGTAAVALWLEALRDACITAVRIQMDVFRRDAAYARRMLMRAPGYAVTVVLVTALGIGTTTATLSMADHVLVRPLPFPDPDRLVSVWQDQTYLGYSRVEVSPGNFRDWVRTSRSFSGLAAHQQTALNMVGIGAPVRLDGYNVTASLFPVLGVAPALGRTFEPADDRAGAAGTVVISDALWTSMFGRDPRIVGRVIRLDAEPHTIIGVMPRGFEYPDRQAQFWRPIRFQPDDFVDRTNLALRAVGRLRDGVTIDQATAEMRVIAAHLERAFPDQNKRTSAVVTPLRDAVTTNARLLLCTLAGAALCLLLIACTNVASLVTTRTLARRRELAVRMAIGATRERLVREILTETILLAACGGGLGVALAAAAVPLVAKLVPTTLPIAAAPSVDLRVLAIAAAATAITAIGCGLLPAWRAAGSHGTATDLRDGQRAGMSRRASRTRAALVVAQVAISLALLVSAGLLVRAFLEVQSTDPGFAADDVLTMRTSLPLPKYDPTAKRAALYRRVIEDVQRLPGVRRAAYISYLPMTFGGGIFPVTIAGKPLDDPRAQVASLRFVTPGLFDALGIPLRLGRDISDADTAESQAVAVVSESFARLHWPGENPLGKQFDFAFHTRAVVGVVGDVKVRGLERRSEPQVYLACRQVPDGWLTFFVPKDLVVRTAAGSTGSLVPAVQRVIAAADPELPVSDVRTMGDLVRENAEPRRVQSAVIAAFAALACLLAGIGLHGLLAFTVEARAREFSIRRALGAQAEAIGRLVVWQAARLAAAGIVCGLLLAYLAAQSFQAVLAGVSPRDPATFAGSVALCVAGVAVGCARPALRSLRADPMDAMRAE